MRPGECVDRTFKERSVKLRTWTMIGQRVGLQVREQAGRLVRGVGRGIVFRIETHILVILKGRLRAAEANT